MTLDTDANESTTVQTPPFSILRWGPQVDAALFDDECRGGPQTAGDSRRRKLQHSCGQGPGAKRAAMSHAICWMQSTR